MRWEGSSLYERVLTGIMTTMIATLSTVTNGGDDKDDGDDGGDDSDASADDGDAGVDYGNHGKINFFPRKIEVNNREFAYQWNHRSTWFSSKTGVVECKKIFTKLVLNTSV